MLLRRQDERACEIKDKASHIQDQGPGRVVQVTEDAGEEGGGSRKDAWL